MFFPRFTLLILLGLTWLWVGQDPKMWLWLWIVGGVTLAVFMWDNRYALENSPDNIFRLFKREPKPRTTTPSPEDTKMAQAQLRVAYNLINTAYAEKRYDPLHHLEEATTALHKVLRLDPNAEIDIKEKDDTHHQTHDSIAAALLYLESTTLNNRARDIIMSRSHDRDELRQVGPLSQRAYQAIVKAVRYAPEHIPYQLHLAKLTSNKRQKRKIVKAILAKEPYNVEALTLDNQ